MGSARSQSRPILWEECRARFHGGSQARDLDCRGAPELRMTECLLQLAGQLSPGRRWSTERGRGSLLSWSFALQWRRSGVLHMYE